MTPAGRQAQQIMRWAWDDPAGRVEDALRRVGELGSTATDRQSQNEIADASTMLSRLKGSLVQNSPSILAQLEQQP